MQGYAPHSGFRSKPSLEDVFFRYNYFCSSAVIDVDFLIVADCDITDLGKFISAQEGLVGEGRDHVHCSCWLLHWMVEFRICGPWGFVVVCYSENFSGRSACLDERITHHASIGSACRVVGG